MTNEPLEKLRSVTKTLLDPSRSHYTMRPEVLELKAILEAASGFHADNDDIAAGESITDSGVAISPAMAAMCVDDYARTIQFIRGLQAAICDTRRTVVDRPVRILYAGCGPWATLAVPLMTVFNPDGARFTLLDIHDSSLASARQLIATLGLEKSVAAFERADAAHYEVDKNHEPDVIVVEMLRAALEAEPQVAVTTNLARQATDALIIPERITIDIALVNSAKEFSFDGGEPARDRIIIGTVFTLEREQVSGPATVRLPDYDRSQYRPMLLTTVNVYGDHCLTDYDSGITCPKQLSLGDDVGPGSIIEFSYEFGATPRLQGRLKNISHQ